MQEIHIDEKTAGGRLDKVMIKYLDKAMPSFTYKMLRKKNIVLNDKKAAGSEILQKGDIIKLYLADDTIAKFHSERQNETRKTPTSFGKKRNGYTFAEMIIYEDDNILAFNKPAGLLSQKSEPSDISVNEMVVKHIGKTDLFTPGISNRLDRNTSGLMIAGKNPAAVRIINRAIKDRFTTKLYICIVQGRMTKDSTIEGYLIKNPVTNKVSVHGLRSDAKEIALHPANEEKSSYIKTKYRVLDANDNATLLLVDLITGKSHQIRAHLASIGHPIIGDFKYGNNEINEGFKQKYKVKDQLLHAYKMKFNDLEGILEYLNGKEITAPLPNIFNTVMKGEKLCLHGSQEA